MINKNLLQKELNLKILDKKLQTNNYAILLQTSINIAKIKNKLLLTKITLKNKILKNFFNTDILHFPCYLIVFKNYLDFAKFININKKKIALIKYKNKLIKNIWINAYFLSNSFSNTFTLIHFLSL